MSSLHSGIWNIYKYIKHSEIKMVNSVTLKIYLIKVGSKFIDMMC